MKTKPQQYFLAIMALISLSVLYLYYKSYFPHFLPKIELPPQNLVSKQLLVSAVSSQSVWDQGYLDKNPHIKNKIIQFEKGTLCNSLKALDARNLTHLQLSHKLKNIGYACEVRPLAVNLAALSLGYLKVDNTTTINPQEPGVAHQEICYERAHPDCVIRIKKDGFPLNRRFNPHSTKAVMIDAQGDPGSYDNEAFKIGAAGQAIPKGPSGKFGLKKCPYKKNMGRKNKVLCEQWVDAIMDQAHPALKEPMRTQALP